MGVTSGNLVSGAATVVWPDRYQYVTVENNDGSAGLWSPPMARRQWSAVMTSM